MSCGFHIEVHGRMVPCGKCQGCLRRRRRAWVARMRLEGHQHSESSFVTLTYRDEELPTVYSEWHDLWIPTLVKSHPQKFIRSVRKKGYAVRYFGSGEYGTKTGRPHYHFILYGLGPGAIELFRETWGRGLVSAYEANARTMSYVAKYCLKHSRDPELELPEYGEYSLETPRLTEQPFRLFSRNPPLGGAFTKAIADSLRSRHGVHVLHDPSVHAEKQIRIGGDKYPLDRTMRLRVMSDMGMQPEQMAAIFNSEIPEITREQTQAAQVQHKKALRDRHSRSKL